MLAFITFLPLSAVASGWVPNVIHFINHSPAIEPREPVIQVPESVVDSAFTINWSMYDGQQYNFLLEYQLAGETDWHTLYQGTETSFNTSSVALAGGDYQIRLSCNDATCPIQGYISDNITLIAIPVIPVVTSSVNVTPISTGFVINFGQVSQAEYYQLFENERLIETINSEALPADGSPVSLDKQQAAAGDYLYALRACNDAGCSELSASTTVMVYVPAIKPQAPLTSALAYPVNTSLEVFWTQVDAGLTAQYFYRTGQEAEALNEDIYQQAVEITAETELNFDESGYVWLFVKVCDVLNTCSEYSDVTKIQIFTKPESAPEIFTATMYGAPLDTEVKMLSVPVAEDSAPAEEKFVLHWQPSNELAPSPIGYYKLERNGELDRYSFSDENWLNSIYPEGLFKRLLNLNTQGKYKYSIQACNQMGDRRDSAADCGAKASVNIYVDMPIPLVPPPEKVPDNVSVSHYGEVIDNARLSISVETGEKFVLHWQPSDEVAANPTGSYHIFRNGESWLHAYGTATSALERLYPDGWFHRQFTLDTPGTYVYTVAGCNDTGYGRECGPQSPEIEVLVNNNVQPVNPVKNLAVSAYDAPIYSLSQSILLEKNKKFVLHFQHSNEISPPPKGFYKTSVNGELESYNYANDTWLNGLYPDDLFRRLKTLVSAGNYIYTVQACNLTGTKRDDEKDCGPASEPVTVGIYDDLSVFSDSNGDLYFFTPQSQGQKLLKLSLNDGVWSLTELATTLWDSLVSGLSVSDYRLEIGLFSGDDIEDIKLVHSDSTKVLFLMQSASGYDIRLNLAPQSFTVDRAVIETGETVKLNWQMSADFPQAVTYNLFVEKPDGSPRYLFAGNVNGQSHERLINMAGEHKFFVQACESDNVCGATSSLTVTVIQGTVINTELLGVPVISQAN
ncbi:hypothetical protein SG34_022375 [Thalassomonas viridans]|uniref:Uncharacterized protein n=1 Tax=Thalassomonas viridans TaxID=137584 RepID=A0AAF0C865_9GAMM|nr:hypothetical protein [Thalassomonas viridans]WDE04081.1 hypothetical protein SG34_022375 [Thalassomonas viridans]